MEALAGPDVDQPGLSATKHTQLLAPDVDPAEPIAEAVDTLRKTASLEGVHSAALGVDPARWELVYFTVWSGPEPGAVPGTRYQVLHLSTPGTKELLRR